LNGDTPEKQRCELCGDPAEERFLIVIRYFTHGQQTLDPSTLNLWVCEECRDQYARFHKLDED
jgi:hypothetical protein